jgi:hypothetical protein
LNQLCDIALVYAFAERRTTIDADLISQVVRDRKSWLAMPTFSTSDPAAAAGMTSGAR